MAKITIVGNAQQAQHHRKQQMDQLISQRLSLRHKMDSLLMSNNVLKTDEARQACSKIDNIPISEVSEYITGIWGPLYCNKVQPLLHSISTIDNELAKLEDAQN